MAARPVAGTKKPARAGPWRERGKGDRSAARQRQLRRFAAGMLTAMQKPAVAAALTAVVVLISGCETNDFEGRLRALDGAYERGKQARARYDKVGIAVGTEAACNDAWVSTGTRDEEQEPRNIKDPNTGKSHADTNFQELRRQSFINGCMLRPNTLTSPGASPAATAVPSVAASTAR